MYRMMPWGWMLGIWAALASDAGVATAANTLELTWCTIEASSCRSTAGNFQLVGITGQHDAGTLSAAPLELKGGFLLPGDPVLTLLAPASQISWEIGGWVDIQCWKDQAVTSDRIRLELWRNKKKASVLTAREQGASSLTYTVQVPQLTAGSGYSVRAISELLEAAGNPNPWVETGPIITLYKRSGATPGDWMGYE